LTPDREASRRALEIAPSKERWTLRSRRERRRLPRKRSSHGSQGRTEVVSCGSSPHPDPAARHIVGEGRLDRCLQLWNGHLVQVETRLPSTSWSTSAPPAKRGETEGGPSANRSDARLKGQPFGRFSARGCPSDMASAKDRPHQRWRRRALDGPDGHGAPCPYEPVVSEGVPAQPGWDTRKDRSAPDFATALREAQQTIVCGARS
jgi:hypothetical protein